MGNDFTKEFFQQVWGENGYYENFNYGVGIDKVCEIALYPFLGNNKVVLEIGSGGGVFTERIINGCEHLTAIDVIPKPVQFEGYEGLRYIELPDQSYDCPGIEDNSIDFCFSYNVFCHLSNELLTEYFKNIYRVLNPGADFVFMLANFHHSRKYFPEQADHLNLGEMTPIGHFYQDERTLNIIANPEGWEVVSRNMIPDHRDLVIHLKKKVL